MRLAHCGEGEKLHESSHLLRRVRNALAGVFGGGPQADGADRLSSSALARDEILRAFWLQGFYFMPGLPRGHHQKVLSSLRPMRLQRFLVVRRWQVTPALQ